MLNVILVWVGSERDAAWGRGGQRGPESGLLVQRVGERWVRVHRVLADSVLLYPPRTPSSSASYTVSLPLVYPLVSNHMLSPLLIHPSGPSTSDLEFACYTHHLLRATARPSDSHASTQSYTTNPSDSTALSPTTRPNPVVLYTQRILPSPSLLTSPSISARAHNLGKLRARDEVRRALMSGLVGQRTLGETVEYGGGGGEGRWGGGERVRWAICTGIREKRRFFEQLARAG